MVGGGDDDDDEAIQHRKCFARMIKEVDDMLKDMFKVHSSYMLELYVGAICSRSYM
jgi:hypothetical protein